MPPRELRVHESLRRHTEADDHVDPITHEVLRHALWNVNTEHGNTIMKISGSPICAYGHDFNPSILDENGDFVFFGPFLQYLSAAAGAAVKWTLEHRSENPGIHDGDVFLTSLPEQENLMVEAGFCLNSMKLLPFVQYSDRNFDDDSLADTDKLMVGIGYMFAGHNGNLKFSYGQHGVDGGDDRDEFWLQLQLFRY